MYLDPNAIFRFGPYVLNVPAGSLRKDDELIALPPKVFDTLLVLVQSRGEVVTKQQLMNAVWPDTFVEESNLTQNVFLLRRKLGQTPVEGGEYIQTLAKRGYRITVPVQELTLAADNRGTLGIPGEGPASTATLARKRLLSGRRPVIFALAGLVLAGVLGAWVIRESSRRPTVSDFFQITHDSTDKRGKTGSLGGPDAALLTDGSRIYFTAGSSNASSLWQVSTTGGEPAEIPVPFPLPQMLDFSPVRSELLVAASVDEVTSRPLWAVPVPAGTPHRLGTLAARDASWSPDGREIAFTDGTDLYKATESGTEVKKLAALPGLGWRPRWSPDGKLLRFTIVNAADASQSLWEVGADGKHLHPLLPGWNHPPAECCGVWTPDGKQFVFQAARDGKTEVWSLPSRGPLDLLAGSASVPIQLTSGQMNSLAPALSPDGRKLFVIGQELRGELQKYDAREQRFAPFLGAISADFVEFSRDGQWVLYIAFPGGTLWRSRADGTERLQLTFPPMEVMVPHWSPDGKRIAFYGFGAGRQLRVYIISADGGLPSPASDGPGGEMQPSWSPDGNSLMYSDFPFFGGDPQKVAIHILDLRTRRAETLRGAQGYFAPAWSPDGRYIAASTVRGSKVMLFDFRNQQWAEIAVGWGFMKWSLDSQYLYFLRHGSHPAILKIRIADRKIEEAASLSGTRLTGHLAGLEYSLAPDGSPVVLRDTGIQEIYSLSLFH
jgi:Tol biopolymer transport system component/DNA-binding winged helix-turn-helix (wHTH) protein